MRWLARSATPLVIAAMLVAGGGAYALAASSSKTITVCVSHKGGALYKARKCKKHDKKLSWAKQGPRGTQGPAGPQGPAGATGPQGPGGSILTWDAAATSSPTPTTIGTVLGDTFSARCVLAGSLAQNQVYLQTSNGSLSVDVGSEDYDVSTGVGTAFANHISVPAGTVTSPALVQLAPAPGSLTLHLTATDTTSPSVTQTCHVSIESYPTSLTSVASAQAPARAAGAARLAPDAFFRR